LNFVLFFILLFSLFTLNNQFIYAVHQQDSDYEETIENRMDETDINDEQNINEESNENHLREKIESENNLSEAQFEQNVEVTNDEKEADSSLSQEIKGLTETNGIKITNALARVSPPYRDGDKGQPIVEMKEKLVKLGFATWSNPSQHYGNHTIAAVNRFQEYYGFNEPGIVTQKMLDKMDDLLASPYSDGNSGSHIYDLKEDLVSLGFASWDPPTNVYGSITARTVKSFQEYYDLPVSGIAEDNTRAKITEILTPPYCDGDRGQPIVELKQKLVALDFASWSNPSQYYGSNTIASVNRFQEYYGFNQPGIVTQEMLDKMDELLSVTYRDGDSGDHIYELKKDLVRLGFASWDPPTNVYGRITSNVVKDFQSYYGLPTSGIADELTRAKMNEVLAPPYRDGDRGQPIVEIKEKLVELGFASWSSPSQFYGSNTAKAVKNFQRYYDLEQDGVVGFNTLEVLNNAISGEVSRYDDGDQGPHIVEMKEKLVELGFASWSDPSQFYGSHTIAAVNRFQRYYGLPVTNQTTIETLQKMDDILTGPFNKGDSGQHVRELKEKLVILGFASWTNPTQHYGMITSGVVEDFQRAYGLTVNGIADEVTLAKIEASIVKIFLDPGHGGRDPGGQGYKLNEKDVVLDIALKTAQILSDNYFGVDVRLSRTNDSFIELEDRAKMANDWNADYFVSIHTNAHDGTGTAHGFESFIFNGNVSNETIRRQREIHSYLINRINRVNRRMSRANFSVLRNTKMPSLLIEFLFIDNYEENLLLSNPNYRTNLANYTAEAIANSFNLKRR